MRRSSSRCRAVARSRPTTRCTRATSSRGTRRCSTSSTRPTSCSSRHRGSTRRRPIAGGCRCRTSSTSTWTRRSSTASSRRRRASSRTRSRASRRSPTRSRRAARTASTTAGVRPSPVRPAAVHRRSPADRAADLRLLPRPARRDAARRHHTHDAATINGWSGYFWPTYVPEGNIWPWGSAALGFALPIGNGAAVAAPDRRVIAFMGDGGFGFTAMELATAVALRAQRDGHDPQRQRLLLDRELPAGCPRSDYEVDLTNPNFVDSPGRSAPAARGRALGGRGAAVVEVSRNPVPRSSRSRRRSSSPGAERAPRGQGGARDDRRVRADRQRHDGPDLRCGHPAPGERRARRRGRRRMARARSWAESPSRRSRRVDALLERPDVDAVVIATPHTTHLPLARRRPPPASTSTSRSRWPSTSRVRPDHRRVPDAGVRLTVASQSRYNEISQRVKELIEDGTVGESGCSGHRPTVGWDVPADGWFVDPKEGGAYLDWGPHGVDTLRWFTGSDATLAFGMFDNFGDIPAARPAAPWSATGSRRGHGPVLDELRDPGAGPRLVHAVPVRRRERHGRLRPRQPADRPWRRLGTRSSSAWNWLVDPMAPRRIGMTREQVDQFAAPSSAARSPTSAARTASRRSRWSRPPSARRRRARPFRSRWSASPRRPAEGLDDPVRGPFRVPGADPGGGVRRTSAAGGGGGAAAGLDGLLVVGRSSGRLDMFLNVYWLTRHYFVPPVVVPTGFWRAYGFDFVLIDGDGRGRALASLRHHRRAGASTTCASGSTWSSWSSTRSATSGWSAAGWPRRQRDPAVDGRATGCGASSRHLVLEAGRPADGATPADLERRGVRHGPPVGGGG